MAATKKLLRKAAYHGSGYSWFRNLPTMAGLSGWVFFLQLQGMDNRCSDAHGGCTREKLFRGHIIFSGGGGYYPRRL